MRSLSAFSLTTRVAIAAFVATAVPIAVAYGAVVSIPHRLAQDAVSLDMRTVAQNITTDVGQRRLDLRERVATQAGTRAFQRAALTLDAAALRRSLHVAHVTLSTGAHVEAIPEPISGRAIVRSPE